MQVQVLVPFVHHRTRSRPSESSVKVESRLSQAVESSVLAIRPSRPSEATVRVRVVRVRPSCLSEQSIRVDPPTLY